MAPPRPTRRLPHLLLLAGGGLLAVFAVLAGRALWLERQLRVAALERAHGGVERLLQRAPGSQAAFAAVPPAQQAAVGPEGTPVAADVAWLAADGNGVDRDPVVEDRLERATQAEFGPGGAAAARAQFDALLAAALVPPVRLQVLAAAAWQAHRAGDTGRATELLAAAAGLLGEAPPRWLGLPGFAAAAASSLRLAQTRGERPAWAARLAPYLPASLLATLPDPAPWAAANAAVARRRADLAAVAARCGPLVGGPAAFAVLDAERLLWWQPAGADAAALAWGTPAELLGWLAAAAAQGELPDWPAELEPRFVAPPAGAFAGVPGLAEPQPAAALRRPEWLLPAAAGALLLLLGAAFAAAFRGQLRAAQRELAAARVQAEFLTTVTHELKTPLAAIRLLGELLVEGRAAGREADYHRMLTAEAVRLSTLIENVLDLGRLERGERTTSPRPTDLGEVVAETLSLFAPLAARDGLAVEWTPPAAPLVLPLDRGALVQALVAVLDNARKYAAAGGRVLLSVHDVPAAVELAVRDFGPGVPAAERERIFARFARGAAHQHGSTPGLGLGLHLARTLLRRLGGDLRCGDPLDGGPGACFTLCLPRETPP